MNVYPEIDPETGVNLVTVDVQGLEQATDDFWLHVTCQIEKYKAYIADMSSFPQEYIDPYADYFHKKYSSVHIDNYWYEVDGKVYSFEDAYEKRIEKLLQHGCKLETPDIRVSEIPSRWHEINNLVLGEQRGLDSYGLRSSQEPKDGDRIVRLYKPELSRITVQQRLMPTIYRET